RPAAAALLPAPRLVPIRRVRRLSRDLHADPPRPRHVRRANPSASLGVCDRAVGLHRPAALPPPSPEGLGPAQDVAETELRSDRNDPEETLRARDAQTVVQQELARMSEKNRVAYILIREEELSVKDAAAILGLTEDAVKKRAHKEFKLD